MTDSGPVASTSAIPISLASDPSASARGSHHDGSSDEHEPGGERAAKRKKTRHRQALSCVACKKRKIKCDRQIPCEACLKRGDQAECHWEEKERPPPPQVFALAADMDAVKRKVSHIESVLSRLVDGSAAATTTTPTAPPGFVVPSLTTAGPVINGADADSLDTEDAALVLEEIAMGRRRVYGSLKAKPPDHLAAASIPRPQLVAGGHLTSCRRGPDKTRPVSQAFFDRDALLNLIWSALPPRHICDELLEIYFSSIDWSWKTHHTPAFRAEVEEFWELMATGQQNQTDPAWLGVLCATLCVALNTRGTDTPLGSLEGQQLRDQPGVLFELSFTALRAAQWSARPQVRVIQTCLLWGPFLTHFSGGFSSERAGHMLVWASSAIRIAQLLGLHSLGPGTDRLPPDDPAWPSGNNSMKREMAKRLWHALVLLDWTNGARGGTTCIAPDQSLTELPLNLNDDDLGLHVEVTPRPANELTDVSYGTFKVLSAANQRRVQDAIRKGEYNYDAALEFDRDFRDCVSQFTGAELMATIGSPVVGKPTKAQWLRGAIASALHNRLCRLHRPFMAHGFKHPRYEASTRFGIDSARTIIRCHHVLLGAPPSQYWSVYLHTIGAALLLAMATLHDIDVGAPPAQVDTLLGDMVKARAFFKAGEGARNSSVRAVASQGGRIVASLVDAVRKHRAAADAGLTAETYVDVLRRLASRLSTTAAERTTPASPALPPVADADPTLASDIPARDLLQSMGLLDTSAAEHGAYSGTFDAWTSASDYAGDNADAYMGEGIFSQPADFIDWNGLLSGSHGGGW